MTIQDVDKFLTFIEKWINPETSIYNFNRQYRTYIKKNASPVEAEIGFLKLLERVNAGISILKSNDDFTQYNELKLIHNNTTILIPCN